MGIPEGACLSWSIKKWTEFKSQQWWRDSPGQRQAKSFLEERKPKLTEELLNFGRKAVRILVGLLTGHCRLNKHMNNLGMEEDALCRFCQEEEETATDVLCHCDGLTKVGLLQLGCEKGTLSGLWNFIKMLKLDREL